ncbi:hypothetical protein [Lactiplantibacillus mudanjiangensis]|uniref:DUF1659 domain-containing protein n=1 Tax=Lactiplantibacillus mudanjiangensis TaxID=1296538 RepID=A0A660DWL2_9LACO|nr:hypothetical protein [Lactiplantibacillus mudanjiangensis]VDG17543.1 hypothetical protein [Lactobacillus sp. CBA3605] [Lactiplantibacillus mudanjiangensis]VDG23490.1 hypothetical protein [Lactobacillus sp. CBA3605] [Lactiplantibacillus mudanjiangensis]VDG27747.1 hypothetical protein [Lactobacillus sp. CBA3605] [Lactiplantibacillus mudanjiangensis]VDG32775.1 hypothetical protein [Lactobacillus sp. CBA3605] [Lactiplantibacillus mudanjiangensis]
MNKTWMKSTLVMELLSEDGEKHKQAFNALTQDPTDAQLATFNTALETLTGDQVKTANVVSYHQYHATPAV